LKGSSPSRAETALRNVLLGAAGPRLQTRDKYGSMRLARRLGPAAVAGSPATLHRTPENRGKLAGRGSKVLSDGTAGRRFIFKRLGGHQPQARNGRTRHATAQTVGQQERGGCRRGE